MDSALAVFLCLAAVASIAYCQTPTCPPELQTPTLDPIYRRDSYVNPREWVVHDFLSCWMLLPRTVFSVQTYPSPMSVHSQIGLQWVSRCYSFDYSNCSSLLSHFHYRAPFGIPRLLRRTYYVCREGMPQPLGLPGLGQQLYTCSDPVQIEVPDDEPVDVEVPDAFPIEVQPIPDDSTSGDDSAISPETVRPPTPAPSTKPENPTETENDRMSCQRGFATSNYLYSSL